VREYDLIADWYASNRTDVIGVPEVTVFASALPRGSRVLDIGCGNGIPLTGVLLEAGHRVFGLDSSAQMLARFRANYPDTPVIRGSAQTCGFASGSFDAAIAWGVMFHLDQPDQTRAIASVSRILRPGAPFLFTSGDVDGPAPAESTMNGVVFRSFSFSIEDYRRVLGDQGFTLSSVHADRAENTYYLAQKSA
jgi:SAM-dependent methyltransferase